MKRKLFLTLTILAFSTALFAQTTSIHIKGGAQYPSDPDKIGLDSAITFNLGLDKYFTAGVESGFGWIKWKDKGNSIELPGGTPTTQVTKTNLYSLPLLAVATVRLADMMADYGFMPYITGGAGYSWTWYREPGYKSRFDGFTWQAVGGVEIKLGEGSGLALVIEGGYRGAAVENKDKIEVDMSGFIGRVGISVPLGASSDF
ncbi:MAG: porin family protein [Leptospirales bacterium]|nr:porin family protein [Leptospirales bacterium]